MIVLSTFLKILFIAESAGNVPLHLDYRNRLTKRVLRHLTATLGDGHLNGSIIFQFLEHMSNMLNFSALK